MSELKNYEVSRTVATTQNPSNRIVRIDAAVLLRENTIIDPTTGLEVPEVMAPELMKEIEQLVSSALGMKMARGDTLAGFNNHPPIVINDVERRDIAAQALGDQVDRKAVLLDVEDVLGEEQVENVLGAVLERTQEDRGRQLAAAVDPDKHTVFRVELEVEP